MEFLRANHRDARLIVLEAGCPGEGWHHLGQEQECRGGYGNGPGKPDKAGYRRSVARGCVVGGRRGSVVEGVVSRAWLAEGVRNEAIKNTPWGCQGVQYLCKCGEVLREG